MFGTWYTYRKCLGPGILTATCEKCLGPGILTANVKIFGTCEPGRSVWDLVYLQPPVKSVWDLENRSQFLSWMEEKMSSKGQR
ncbi:hypothetical protein CEXT_721541 [Caerostris extrusa]|uniref:Uncharacterized protein n=1 Tax=Caerostris extrusa TaxID=172846 RepID=A0AAV4QBP9_CAEEX|nr:hypothetical protein CEXT_721541 [Caerostris extrusa]